MRMRNTLLASLIAASLVLGGCGTESDTSGDAVRIVATTSILGDVVSNVVDGEATVEVLMPIGADPHDFVASSQQVASLNEADLVVANGFGLEEGLEDVLDAAIDDGVRVLFASDAVEPIEWGDHEDADHEDAEHEDEDHDHGDFDPHFWLDPVRMSHVAEAIGDDLAFVDPDSGTDWVVQADDYSSVLLETNDEIVGVLDDVGNRKLVTNHGSFNYFAERYDFEVVGVIIPGGSTLGDPSSQELADLVEVIGSEDVSAIFTETTDSADLAEALADELDREIQIVELYTGSLGEAGSGADTYVGMLTTNAGLIADALG